MTEFQSQNSVVSQASPQARSQRANALADRLERGLHALIAFAGTLTDEEWRTRLPKDGRKIGVVVHHVASVYPIEIDLARTLASGRRITGVTMDGIDEMNAVHARKYDAVTIDGNISLNYAGGDLVVTPSP